MITRATNPRDARAVPGARFGPSRLSGVSGCLVAAALAFAAPMAGHTQQLTAALAPGVAAVSDEALPGEGRPPSPGPTEPDVLAG